MIWQATVTAPDGKTKRVVDFEAGSATEARWSIRNLYPGWTISWPWVKTEPGEIPLPIPTAPA